MKPFKFAAAMPPRSAKAVFYRSQPVRVNGMGTAH